MPRLCVNIDHIATVREARKITQPDPVAAAALAEAAGAEGITCHLREDRRHVNDDDVRRLRASITTFFNLEMALTDEMVRIALETKPEMVTLVPESRAEITTEGGLDVVANAARLTEAIAKFHAAGIAVSLFVDPDAPQIAASKAVGADVVELHTGPYANTFSPAESAPPEAFSAAFPVPPPAAAPEPKAFSAARKQAELQRLAAAADQAHALGLVVNAGHGLTLTNVAPIAAIPHMQDLHIGHSIIAHATYVGITQATRAMAQAIHQAVRPPHQ